MSVDPLGSARSYVDQARLSALAPPSDTSKVKPEEAARQFESYLAQLMIREMKKTVPEGMFNSPAMEVFSDLFDAEIATRLSEGQGLGLAAQITARITGQPLHGQAQPRGLRPEHGVSPLSAGDVSGARLPVVGRFTSRFGQRADPFDGSRRNHQGVDIAAARGAPVSPVMSGVVTMAGPRNGYGNVVVVDHGNGLTTLYAHCDSLDVAAGQAVSPGDIIARVGDTGRATGPHLHFEVRSEGRAVDPMDTFGWRP